MGGGEMRLRGGGEDGGGELRLPMARIPCCPRCAEHTAELRLVGWTQREPQHSPKPHSGGQRKQHEPAAAGSPWCRIAGDNGTTGQRDNGTTLSADPQSGSAAPPEGKATPGALGRG